MFRCAEVDAQPRMRTGGGHDEAEATDAGGARSIEVFPFMFFALYEKVYNTRFHLP